MIDRRAFIAGAIALSTPPLAAEAQRAAKIARIGYLATNQLAASPPSARGLPSRTA
jgi:hypothetical protein